MEIVDDRCPAVQITTDVKGQYDNLLLPYQYRIAIPADSSNDPTMFADLPTGFEEFGVEGWSLNNPSPYNDEWTVVGSPWAGAFANHIKTNTTGYNSEAPEGTFTVWNCAEAPIEWTQTDEYPNSTGVSDDDAIPSTGNKVWLRQDMVWTADPSITVKQLEVDATDPTAPLCSGTATLNGNLQNHFLGELMLEQEVEASVVDPTKTGTQLYVMPLYANFFMRAVAENPNDFTESDGTAISAAKITQFQSVAPFPFGLPILHSGTSYCMNITATAKYQAQHPDAGDPVSAIENVSGQGYQVDIFNTADNTQNHKLALPAGTGGVNYLFSCVQPERTDWGSAPEREIRVTLEQQQGTSNTYSVVGGSGWTPWSYAITDTSNAITPGLADSFSTDVWRGIIVGGMELKAGLPVSGNALLDFVLRDPPGDNSSCSLETGSTIGFSRSASKMNGSDTGREKNQYFASGPSATGGMVVAPMGIGVQLSATISAEAGGSLSNETTISENEGGEVSVNESMTFTQSLTTSSEPLTYNWGTNQDLFFGRTENTIISERGAMRLMPTSNAIKEAQFAQWADDLDIDLSTPTAVTDASTDSSSAPKEVPTMVTMDNDHDGFVDVAWFIPATKSFSDAGIPQYDFTPGNQTVTSSLGFNYVWKGSTAISSAPASFFSKTQYTIETQDIPSLESARDSYFANAYIELDSEDDPGYGVKDADEPYLYAYPDGTPPTATPSWTYPEGMQIANNDDQRWVNYHADWITQRQSDKPNFFQQDNVQRGYTLGDGFWGNVGAIPYDPSINLGSTDSFFSAVGNIITVELDTANLTVAGNPTETTARRNFAYGAIGMLEYLETTISGFNVWSATSYATIADKLSWLEGGAGLAPGMIFSQNSRIKFKPTDGSSAQVTAKVLLSAPGILVAEVENIQGTSIGPWSLQLSTASNTAASRVDAAKVESMLTEWTDALEAYDKNEGDVVNSDTIAVALQLNQASNINTSVGFGDRRGPGYIFLGSEARLDSVYWYNEQINNWKRMLAENELEKLQARRFILSNLSDYDGIEDLSTWQEDLEQSFAVVNNYNLEDFTTIAAEDYSFGTVTDGSGADDYTGDQELWDEADFEPFFITFSGGGSEYTQTVSKTTVQEETRTRTLAMASNRKVGMKIDCDGVGFESAYSVGTTVEETRSQSLSEETNITYSYTLADGDEQDFYLVGVIPGRGMDGPIFLNLGSATTCPWDPGEQTKYSEFYADLFAEPLMKDTVGNQLGRLATQSKPTWAIPINVGSTVVSDAGVTMNACREGEAAGGAAL